MKTFLGKVVKIYPVLPYVALGLWLSWCYIAYCGIAWLSASETNGENISTLYIVSSISFAVVFLAATFFAPRLRKALSHPRFTVTGGVIASLGCAIIIVIGPYYLSLVWPFEVIRFLFYVGCALTGIGTALLALKIGELYGGLSPRKVILYVAFSHITVAVIYYIVIGTPVWQPITGGPSFMGILSFIGLPLLASLFAVLSFLVSRENTSSNTQLEDTPVYEESRVKFPRSFWKLVVVTFVFSFTVFALRSALITFSPVDVTFELSSLVMLLRMVVSLAFVLAAIGINGERFSFGKIYSVIMAFVVILIAVCSIVGVMHVVWAQFITLISYVYELVLWCLLAFIVYQKRISAVLVFGFGYGAFMLGGAIGWLAGVHVLPDLIVSPYSFVAYFALMALVLVCAFILFSEKEIDNLFRPHSAREASLDTLLGKGFPEEDKREAPSKKQGKFAAAIEEIASRGDLSQRETDVMRCLAMGYETLAIAKKLNVSWNTVRTHTRNVYAKLDVHSKQELIELVDEATHRVP